MYKDVLKRITAFLLIFCMIGTMQDYSLLAKEITGEEGATHTYADSMGDVEPKELANGQYFANAFTIEPNADAAKNVQVLKSISFALDVNLHGGDITKYVKTADYTVNVFKYTNSPLDVIGGTPDASVTGTYDIAALTAGNDSFAVDFGVGSGAVYSDGGSFLAFSSGENYVVQVVITNAAVWNDSGAQEPADTPFHVKTAVSADSASYIEGAFQTNKTVCIQAVTAEAFVEEPLTGISFTESSVEMKVGDKKTIGVEYQPAATSQKTLTWTSDNSAVASVNADTGEITAVSQGTANITATSAADTGISDVAVVNICKDMGADPSITVSAIGAQTYTGEQLRPTFSVQDGETDLTMGTHYTVGYGENKNAGTGAGTVTIRGAGNGYLGEKTVTFDILPTNMSSSSIIVALANPADPKFIYNGSPIILTGTDLTVNFKNETLTEGTHYRIKSQGNNTAAGNGAYVILEGIPGSNFTGASQPFTYGIKKSIKDPSVKVSLNNTMIDNDESAVAFTYDNSPKKPAVGLTDTSNPAAAPNLKIDRDYKVTWDGAVGGAPANGDFTSAGKKQITITGVGAYLTDTADIPPVPETRVITFEIIRRSIKSGGVTKLPIPSQIAGKTTVTGISLSYGKIKLTEGTDYSVTRVDDLAAHTATITIVGQGNYQDTIVETVPMGISISENTDGTPSDVRLPSNLTYTGGEIKPEVKLYIDGVLVNNTNGDCYDVTYGHNTNACENINDADAPYVKITGKGIYAGEIIKKFVINRKDIDSLDEAAFQYTDVEYVKSKPQTDITTPVTISFAGKELKAGTAAEPKDYKLAYSNCQNATDRNMPAQIKVEGQGNFKGTKELEYQINRKAISAEGMTFKIDNIDYSDKISFPYTGEKITPTVKVYQNGVELVKNVDYKLQYGSDNVNVLTDAYVMVIAMNKGDAVGSGNYQTNKTLNFKIAQCDMSAVEISNLRGYDYTGQQIKPFEEANPPKVTIPSSSNELEFGKDFTVTYSNHIEAGNATATLNGAGGNFTGEVPVRFTIIKDIQTAHDTAPKSIKVDNIDPQMYEGVPITPLPTVTDLRLSEPDKPYVLRKDIDYTITGYTDNDEVGIGTVVLEGKGSYKGTIRKTFDIIAGSMSDEDIEVSLVPMDMLFTGSPVEPQVVVTYKEKLLEEGAAKDYTVTYENSVNVTDDSKVIIEGAKNFGGTKEVPYKIKSRELKRDEIKIKLLGGGGSGGDEYEYTGTAVKPNVEIRDTSRDETTGEKDTADPNGYVLKGRYDYKLEYNDQNTGISNEASITIKGTGNYSTAEPIILKYKIKKATLTTANTSISLAAVSYVYTGEPIIPLPEVIYTNNSGSDISLDPGTDFEVDTIVAGAVADAKNVSDGTIGYQIRGVGNYLGTVLSDAGDTFEIKPRPMDSVSIDPIMNQAYTGSQIKPTVNITYRGNVLAVGTDYTCTSFGQNINPDTDDTPLADQAWVEITGKENFKDSKKVYFHIRTDVNKASISLAATEYTFTSEAICPLPQVMLNGAALKNNVDYKLIYNNNVNAYGMQTPIVEEKCPKVIVQGIGKYGGTWSRNFTIRPVNMQDASVPIRLEVRNAEFTGSIVKPEYDLIYEPSASVRYVLKKGSRLDYSQSSVAGIKAGINAGTLEVVPFGMAGNFMSGADGRGTSIAYNFSITPKDITNNLSIAVSIEDAVFTGSTVRPKVTITDKMRKNSGMAQGPSSDGTAYSLVAPGTSGKEADYSITYTPNLVGPGKVTAHIKGEGSYKGTIEDKTFFIKGVFTNAVVELGDAVYAGGDDVKPSIKVTYNNGAITLIPDVDYEYTYYDNKNCSDNAYVIVKGKGSYAGGPETDKKIPFVIMKKDIKKGVETDKDMTLSGILDTYTFTGSDIKPTPIITFGSHNLVENTDFVCTYDANSIDVGSHKVTIAAKTNGNYTGSITKMYEIGTNFNVRLALEKDSYVYTGDEIRPIVTVTDIDTNKVLSLGIDYGVEYQNNIKAGTATIDVFGKGIPYKGNVSKTFTITKKNLGDNDIQIADIDSKTYTGSSITPEPTVRWNRGGTEEEEKLTNTDFVYTYGTNTKAGTGTITIVPADNSSFAGSKIKTFDINKKNIEAADSGVTVEAIAPQTYMGSGICPLPVVKWGEISLTTDDYTLLYDKNINAGQGEMIIHGRTNYTGDIKVDFQIDKRPIDGDSMTIKYQKEWQYTGDKIEPKLEISFLDTNNKLVKLGDSDYTVTYNEDKNMNAGEGEIHITANEINYSGEADKIYTIKPRNITKGIDSMITMSEVKSQILDSEGKAEPKPILTFSPNGANGKKYILQEGADKDYTLEYQNNTTAGQTGTVTVRAKQGGNFTGDRSADYYIGDDVKKYIDAAIIDDISNLVYNGKPQKPTVTVTKKGNADLTENTHYKIVYDEDCTGAGEHTVSVEGMAPYGGSIDMTYTIAKREISNVKFDIPSQTFTGGPIHPLISGVDTEAMTVLGEDTSTAVITGDIDVEGMLTNLDAFTTSLTANVNSGKAVVNITATNNVNSNYKGTAAASFVILSQDIASNAISATRPSDQVYTGNPLQPKVVLTDTRRNADGTVKRVQGGDDYILREGIDYRIKGRENTYPGIASLEVTGNGNYTNSITRTFTITADLSKAVIQAIPDQAYTGGPICPEITVTIGGRKLTKILDYSIDYKSNIDRGTAAVVISQGQNKLYTGSKSAAFNISRDISQAKVTLVGSSFTYTGEAITPGVAVENDNQRLEYGKDYTVTYTNNINVGTATITIIGTGAYNGSIQGNFDIAKKSIIRCDFNELMSQSYTGAPTTQTIYVSDGMSILMESKDYTVKYVNSTSPGTATVTITGSGNYGGVKTIRYNIDVPNMSSVSAKASTTSVKLSWSQVGGVTGYEIYDTKNKLVGKTSSNAYTKKKLKKLTTYSYKVRPYVTTDGATYYGGFSNILSVTTVPSKPSIKLSAGSKSVKITWKKIKGASGYQVYRSTSKKGTYKRVKTITKSSTVSYTNKKLKSKKTYYYKVRAYKTVKGKKVYSSYSSTKYTKAK